MRFALLLALLAACERSGTCEQRMKGRLNGDPRWREMGTSTIGEVMKACRELDAGGAISDKLRKKIDCMLDANSDAAAVDNCAEMVIELRKGPQRIQ